jgi:hypothetical protein
MKSLKEIIAQKEAIEADLFKLDGVTGVDVGYKYKDGKRTDEVTIRVHVAKKKKTVSDSQKIPATIGGIHTDVLEMEIIPFNMSVPFDEASLLADTVKYSTIKGGISIGPERVIGGSVYTGTLGAIVKDNATGQPRLLSNFHVMCVDSGWHVGDQMDQPSRVDGGVAITDRIGTLQKAVLSSHVDGALSTISGRPYQCSIVDIGDVKGTASAVLNAPVRKRGRTTLFTKGFVDAINATVTVNYGPSLGVRTLTNQIGIRPDTAVNPKFSDRGDSGSVVVNASNKVIGLLFAGNSTGYTYINPISFVLSELNVSMCTRISKLPKLEKIELKEIRKELTKDKIEIKENKIEKHEIKELKIEKAENKELIKDGKSEFEKPFQEGKPVTDKLDKPTDGFDPGRLIPGRINPGAINPGTRSIDDRLAALEQSIAGLTSFISADLRPNLDSGALNNEDDYGQQQDDMEKNIADTMEM